MWVLRMEKKETHQERLESIKEVVRKRRFHILLISIGVAVVLVVVLVVTVPIVELRRRIEMFYYGEDKERIDALRWLVENVGGEKAFDFMLEALKNPNVDENTFAYELLDRRLKRGLDRRTARRLVEIWRDENLPRLSREHALFLLAEYGDKSLEPLFLEKNVWLKGSAWDAGCRYIKRLADEKTAEKLLSMLRSSDEEERLAAAFAIRFIRKKEFIKKSRELRKALLSLLKEDLVSLREEAMETLWDWVEREDEEEIVAAICEEERRLQSARVRQYGALALMHIGAKHRVPLLLSLLSDTDGGVIEAAARALKGFADPSVIPKVRDRVFSRDADTVIRLACLEILSAFDTPEAKSTLIQMLYLDDAKVVNRLLRVLWRIADESVVKGVTFAMERAKRAETRALCALLLGRLRRAELIETMGKVARNDVGIVASSVASAFNYMLNERALKVAIDIFDSEDLDTENRIAMVSVLSFYRTPEAVRRLITGVGHDIEKFRERCYFASSGIFSALDELLKGKKPDVMRFLARMVEAKTKKRIREGLRRYDNDFVKLYELLLDAVRRLPVEFEGDRQLLWNAISLLLEHHRSKKLLEWFLKERKMSRRDLRLLIKRIKNRLSRFDTSVDAYKKNRALSAELLKILGFKP